MTTVLPWATSVTALAGLGLIACRTADRRWAGWLLTLVSEALFVWYCLLVGAWGFLPFSAATVGVCLWGFTLWPERIREWIWALQGWFQESVLDRYDQSDAEDGATEALAKVGQAHADRARRPQ